MTLLRILIALGLIALIAGLPNAVTMRALLKVHPRRKRLWWTLFALGNAFWLAVPIFFAVGRLSPLTRVVRSILGPPFFTWLIVTLLYTGWIVVLALAWLPFLRLVRFTRFARIPSAAFLIVLLAVGIEGIWQCLVPVTVERLEVEVPGLDPSLDGYRIALMSDLHVGMFSRLSRLQFFSRKVNETQPDIVFVSGDLVDDDPYFAPKFVRGLEAIDRSKRIIAVLGNHEMYGDPLQVIEALKGTRVELLVNRGLEIRRGSAGFWLAGLSDFAASDRSQYRALAPDVAAALRGKPGSMPAILLSHQPKGFPLAKKHAIPFTISGHSHGGQFGFRRLNWTLAGLFIRYDMGLYTEGRFKLYVNTGTGYWLVPIRVGLTPEITLFTLRSPAGRA